MIFICVLLALIIERFFHWGKYRNWQWLDSYQKNLDIIFAKFSLDVQLFLLIFPIIFVVGFFQIFFYGRLFNIFSLILNLVVLIYCLGPENLWVEFLSRAETLRTVDINAALNHHAAKNLGVGAEFAKVFFNSAYHRVFAVIFWFAILGPVGAILYRIVEQLTERAIVVAPNALLVRQVLDWLPVRLLVLIFALGGHFTEVVSCLKKYARSNLASSDILLLQSGLLALDPAENTEDDSVLALESVELMDRALIMFLVLLAILVLI